MKPSQTKYFLGVALLAIWGLVGFQLYSKFSAKQAAYIPFNDLPLDKPVSQKDSFALLVNYRDPFLEKKLKQPQRTNTSPSKSKKRTRSKAVKPKQKIAFPKMIYKGFIDLKQGRKVALVNIDGKSLNLAWGEKHGDLQIREIYPDSLRVAYQGEEQLILKSLR